MPGAQQLILIRTDTDCLRAGEIYKSTQTLRYAFTSLAPEQADADELLALIRGYWGIETKQHFRRDATQREDHCQVSGYRRARNLSLMRSLAIFLFERQRKKPNAEKSLPDWQARNHRFPTHLIRLLAA